MGWMVFRGVLLVWGLCLLVGRLELWAQRYGVRLEAFVTDDSVSIGQRFFYSVVVDHPDSLQLFFPQPLNRHFLPFTLLRTHLSPSVWSVEAVAKDSVAYELVLLEKTDSMVLQLPVYVLLDGDTLEFLPPARVLRFKSLLPTQASVDTLGLRLQVVFPLLSEQPLYLWWGIGLLIGLWLLWRLLIPLRRYAMKLWILYQWDKRWREYEERVFEQGQTAIRALDATRMERARRQWIEFMELLRGQPLKSLTSVEIAAIWQDEALKQALNCLDKAIYGGHFEQDLSAAWMNLHRLAAEEYERLVKQLKKAKNVIAAARFTSFR